MTFQRAYQKRKKREKLTFPKEREMGQITIRLTDESEIKLQREAQIEKKSLAEYCREKLTGEKEEKESEIDRVRLEYRMDKLEKEQEKLNKLQNEFMRAYLKGQMIHNRLVYRLLEAALDKERANRIWEQVETEVAEKMKKIESGR